MPCRTRCCAWCAVIQTGRQINGGRFFIASSKIVYATCSAVGASGLRVMSWYHSAFGEEANEREGDALEQVSDPAPIPSVQVQTDETMRALDAALARLPARQRQAFLLRSLEGLDVAATAKAMGCSEGSVKTHYFRALQTLRAQLGEYWS